MKTVISYVIALWETIKSLFKNRHHLLTIPLALILFFGSEPLLRQLDPTAAVFDAGVLQVAIIAIFLFFVFLTIAWQVIKYVFGTFYRHLTTELKTDFKQITPWQRLLLSYGSFFALLFALVLLTVKLS